MINCINANQVGNAVQVYKNCQESGVKLSPGAVQSLLELLCFNNSRESLDPEYLEEVWYARIRSDQAVKKTWDESGLAGEIFDSLENKTDAAYCALIQGKTDL